MLKGLLCGGQLARRDGIEAEYISNSAIDKRTRRTGCAGAVYVV